MSIKDEVLKELIKPYHKFWDDCDCENCAEYRNRRMIVEQIVERVIQDFKMKIEEFRIELGHTKMSDHACWGLLNREINELLASLDDLKSGVERLGVEVGKSLPNADRENSVNSCISTTQPDKPDAKEGNAVYIRNKKTGEIKEGSLGDLFPHQPDKPDAKQEVGQKPPFSAEKRRLRKNEKEAPR